MLIGIVWQGSFQLITDNTDSVAFIEALSSVKERKRERKRRKRRKVYAYITGQYLYLLRNSSLYDVFST